MTGADASMYYVVRVWSARDGFHAEVRDVKGEQCVDFTDAGALAAFFAPAGVRGAAGPPCAGRNDREERR